MMFSKLASIFAKSEDGSATIWGLLTFSMTLIVGGYAVDVQNVMTERTRLQAVADSVAHAALLTRELHSENDSISAAALMAENNMPPMIYGSVLKTLMWFLALGMLKPKALRRALGHAKLFR